VSETLYHLQVRKNKGISNPTVAELREITLVMDFATIRRKLPSFMAVGKYYTEKML
jgi:hypothetical protein